MSGKRLVFYALDSDDAPIEATTKRYVAHRLDGVDDFVSDAAPYLTVLEQDDFAREALEARRRAPDARHAEVEAVASWARGCGKPWIGFQLEPIT